MLGLALGAAVLVIIRITLLARESVNWDEFALLHRAYLTGATGEVVGGGRPGLGTLILVPFAEGCRSAVAAIVNARALWTGIVVASGVAYWFLLRNALGDSKYRWIAATTGLALWVLVPPFLRYSIQVRTDQPAILMGLTAGLCLLASRRRPFLAAAAGFLFALGFLFSQKLIYVAGLCGILALGNQFADHDWQWRRELQRALLLVSAFAITVLGYRAVFLGGSSTGMMPVGSAVNVFEYYRSTYGWRLYHMMLPSLGAQAVGVVLLLGATAAWIFRRDRADSVLVGTGWLVAAAGIVVLLFHAARFPYFWMVMGLFPATITALSLPVIAGRIRDPVAQRLVIALLWIPLLIPASRQIRALMRFDFQAVQRDAIAFVARNFPADAQGYHPHGFWVCREGEAAFPVRFRQRTVAEFGGGDAAERITAFLDEFRSRPVQYMVIPEPPYAREIGEFWQRTYVPYSGAVHVPGRIIEGAAGHQDSLNVIVTGTYVWRAPQRGGVALVVEGRTLEPGDTLTFTSTGMKAVSLPDGGEGMLVLQLRDDPSPAPRAFYRAW